jgi:hypothetical protein
MDIVIKIERKTVEELVAAVVLTAVIILFLKKHIF